MQRWIAILAVTFGAFAPAWAAGPGVRVNLENGALVGDVATVTALVTSEAGIARVEFSVDDQVRLTLMKPPFEYKWDTIDETEGRHTIMVAAYDTDGRAATKRTRVEVDNGLTQGIKPHYTRAMALFRKGELDTAALEGRKCARINRFDLDSIKGSALAAAARADYNGALNMLINPPRDNNQIVGDPSRFPLKDRDGLELRAYCYLKRAGLKPDQASAPDIGAALEVCRPLWDAYLADVKAAHPAPYKTLDDRFAIGDALLQHGDLEQALAVYQGANERGPAGVRVKNRVGLALVKLRRFPEAERLLLELINSGQANSATRAVYGFLFLSQRKFARARSEAEVGVERKHPACLLVAAQADIALRDFRHGFEELQQASEKLDTPEIYYVASCVRADAGDLKLATASLIDALVRYPILTSAYVQRGFQIGALVPNAGMDQALAVFDAVLQREPKNPDALLGRAIVLNHRKKYQKAGEIAFELTRDDRFAADAWVCLAASFAGINEQIKATEALGYARKADPDRFNDVIIPKMPDLLPRAGRFRREPLLSPAALDSE